MEIWCGTPRQQLIKANMICNSFWVEKIRYFEVRQKHFIRLFLKFAFHVRLFKVRSGKEKRNCFLRLQKIRSSYSVAVKTTCFTKFLSYLYPKGEDSNWSGFYCLVSKHNFNCLRVCWLCTYSMYLLTWILKRSVKIRKWKSTNKKTLC